MTGILVQPVVEGHHRNLAPPGLGVGRRVIDRKLVENSVLSHPAEALDDLHFFPRVTMQGMNIGRLDHEHITLPVAPGVTHPWTYVLRQPWAVANLDDPSVVYHLRHDHDVVGGLHDRIVIVVEPIGQHRWASIAAEGYETAFGDRSDLWVVVRAELAHERKGLR